MPTFIFTGSRKYRDIRPVQDKIIDLHLQYSGDILIVNGAATGLDTIATTICKRLGIPYLEYPADWDSRGRESGNPGHVRNARMFSSHPETEAVFAYKEGFDFTLSRGGTENACKIAKGFDIPVNLYTRGAWALL